MNYQALLIDIDGTLTHQGQLIDGAAEALAWAREQGLQYRLLTNITARSPVTAWLQSPSQWRACG